MEEIKRMRDKIEKTSLGQVSEEVLGSFGDRRKTVGHLWVLWITESKIELPQRHFVKVHHKDFSCFSVLLCGWC